MVAESTLKTARVAANALVHGDFLPVRALFAALQFPPPQIFRDPSPDLPCAEAQALCRWYAGIRHAEGRAPRDTLIDPFTLKPFLGSLAVIEPLDPPGDFRFRLYGSEITLNSHTDMTGRSTFDLVHTAGIPLEIPIFFAAVNLAAMATKEPWLTIHQPPPHVGPSRWHRLCLPFADEAGHISRLVVQILPLSLAEAARLEDRNSLTPDDGPTGSR